MIRYAKDMQIIDKVQMCGGKGTTKMSPLFASNEFKGRARLICTITLAPGCSVGEHKHEDEEEIIYIVNGKATYYDNREVYELHPGDVALTLGGMSHGIANNTDEMLVYTATILTY